MKEDEIDLRPYFQALLKHWRLVIATTLIAALSAALFTLRVAPVYQATAIMLLVAKNPPNSRLPALARLVNNTVTASDVMADLKDTLPPHLSSRARLITMVKGTVLHGGLIEITVHATDPAITALLANAWAVHYERYVSQLYTVGNTAPTLLRLVSPALEPVAPVPTKTLQNATLAGACGFLFGAAIAVFAQATRPYFHPKDRKANQ